MIAHRRRLAYPVATSILVRALCLTIVIAAIGISMGVRIVDAQSGGPVLTVSADSTMVKPGDWVSFTVIASGSGSYTAIDVDIPSELTISDEVDCVHSTLFCNGSSVSILDADTNRLSVNAPGPDGPGITVRVTVTFSVMVPATAIPGTQYIIVSSVDGLYNILDPFSETDKRSVTFLEVLEASGQRVSPPPVSERDGPSIQITKKRCEGRDIFPVFAESHCVDVPDASFTFIDPRSVHVQTLSSGDRYTPEEWHFSGSSLWSLADSSNDLPMQGVRVVSCLESEPQSDWHSSVTNVVHPDDTGSVLIQWMFAGGPNQTYQPSLDCVWFELPDIFAVPSTLSLQVFTAETPYLNWTEDTGSRLPDLMRGESGEDLEAAMVMTNTETSEVYSFAADAYGQVLVPSGTYSLVETANGVEDYFSMSPNGTTLVEVGLAEPTSVQSAPASSVDTQTFATGALYCDIAECSPVEGATIFYESMDGSVQGSCVTEIIETPNGFGSWCDYQYIPGMPTILTLDESTLPAGWVLTSENPQTYLVPENPDGPLGPVYFQVGPA